MKSEYWCDPVRGCRRKRCRADGAALKGISARRACLLPIAHRLATAPGFATAHTSAFAGLPQILDSPAG
jgi:hypothetical protein